MSVGVVVKGSASWRERAATLAVFMALGVNTGTWAAAIPRLKTELGLDAARLSIVLLVIAVSSVLSTMVAGWVVPRFGSGRASAVAALATVLAFATPGLARSYLELLACGALLGIAAGALEVAVNGHASDIETRWGATIMSSFHAAFSVGGLSGAVLGGLAAAAGAGLQGQLWIPLGLSALLVLVAIPWLGRGVRHAPGERPPFTWPDRPILLLGAIATLCYLLEGAMADWSALYMTTIAQASVATAAVGYAAFSVTMAMGRGTGDVVVARLGAARVMVGGGLLAAVGLALAVAVPAPWTAGLGFALVGIGAANIVPLVFSAAGRLGATPAAGIALVSTFGFAGFLGGPPLIGAVATWAGLRTGFGALLVVALAMAIIAARSVPRGRG